MAAILLEQQLGGYLMRYSDQVNKVMLNLLDSHDTERFLLSCGGRKEYLMAAHKLFVMKRTYREERIIILINLMDEDLEYEVNEEKVSYITELLSGWLLEAEGRSRRIVIHSKQALYLKLS